MSVFLDFDGTITSQDTISHLAQVGLRWQKKQKKQQTSPSPSPSYQSLESLDSAWQSVVSSYVTSYTAASKDYVPAATDRTTPEQETTYLRSFKNVERESLARVGGCGVFLGVGREEFRAEGRRLAALAGGGGEAGAQKEDDEKAEGAEASVVAIRPGFAEFVNAARRRGWDVWIVSLNWSTAFIEGVCAHAGVQAREYRGHGILDGDDDDDDYREGFVRIVANDIKPEDGTIVGPWILQRDHSGGNKEEEAVMEERQRLLTNSQEKLEVMNKILVMEWERGKGQNKKKPSLYAGDSTTDLECLLAATRGLVLADRDDTSLLKTLRRIGREVPEYTANREKQRKAEEWTVGENSLCWASGFEAFASDEYFEDLTSSTSTSTS